MWRGRSYLQDVSVLVTNCATSNGVCVLRYRAVCARLHGAGCVIKRAPVRGSGLLETLWLYVAPGRTTGGREGHVYVVGEDAAVAFVQSLADAGSSSDQPSPTLSTPVSTSACEANVSDFTTSQDNPMTQVVQAAATAAAVPASLPVTTAAPAVSPPATTLTSAALVVTTSQAAATSAPSVTTLWLSATPTPTSLTTTSVEPADATARSHCDVMQRDNRYVDTSDSGGNATREDVVFVASLAPTASAQPPSHSSATTTATTAADASDSYRTGDQSYHGNTSDDYAQPGTPSSTDPAVLRSLADLSSNSSDEESKTTDPPPRRSAAALSSVADDRGSDDETAAPDIVSNNQPQVDDDDVNLLATGESMDYYDSDVDEDTTGEIAPLDDDVLQPAQDDEEGEAVKRVTESFMEATGGAVRVEARSLNTNACQQCS